MSEHRYDIRISEAVLIRIRLGSKDRTKTTFPVCRRGNGAHWKKPHMSLTRVRSRLEGFMCAGQVLGIMCEITEGLN